MLLLLSLACTRVDPGPAVDETAAPEDTGAPACALDTPCDDGDACTGSDACDVDGACLGAPVVCDAPPPATCATSTTLRTAVGVGTCDDGGCDYPVLDETCETWCEDGACAIPDTYVGNALDWFLLIGSEYVYGPDVAAMPDGDFVVIGQTSDPTTIGGTEVDPGPYGWFITRLAPDGAVRWARPLASVDGTGERPQFVVAPSLDGAVYVGGSAIDPLELGAGTANPLALDVRGGGGGDSVLARLDADGTPEWAVLLSNGVLDGVNVLAGMPDGGVVVGGYHMGQMMLGAGEPNETVVPGDLETWTGWVARYGAEGTLLWAWGGLAGPIMGVAVTDEVIYVAASFSEETGFDNGDVVAPLGYDNDVYVAALTHAGAFVWTDTAQGTNGVTVSSVAATSDGGVALAGDYGGRNGGELVVSAGTPEEDWSPRRGGADAWFAKWGPDGVLAWANSGGGMASGLEIAGATDIAGTDDGGVQVIGHVEGDLLLDDALYPVTLYDVYAGAEDRDIWYVRYDADGAFVGGNMAGGEYRDGGEAVAWGPDGPVLTGTFRGTATFGLREPGELAVEALVVESAGVWKLAY